MKTETLDASIYYLFFTEITIREATVGVHLSKWLVAVQNANHRLFIAVHEHRVIC